MPPSLKSLFGSKRDKTPGLDIGDIFYTQSDTAYRVFKMLRKDEATYHVAVYEETPAPPSLEAALALPKFAGHAPIAKTGFVSPVKLGTTPVTVEELEGYFIYLQQTGQMELVASEANQLYKAAYALTNKKQHADAIQHYTAAIALIPQFYEAIDNRAFCHMDLGEWQTAIDGFQHSLQVNPNAFGPRFSIGECHMRLKDYETAAKWLQSAAEIDPNNRSVAQYLEFANAKSDPPHWS